jgi:hypothetical protein
MADGSSVYRATDGYEAKQVEEKERQNLEGN